MSNDNLIAFQPPESSASFNDALSELVRKGDRQTSPTLMQPFLQQCKRGFIEL